MPGWIYSVNSLYSYCIVFVSVCVRVKIINLSYTCPVSQLKWSSGASANLGKKLAPSDMSDEPSVSWLCDPHEKYSAFLFALDVLGKDNDLLDEGRLWFVANITNCDWRNSEIVVDYLPPTPLHDTGEHRYVFLVYKQPCGMYYEEPFVESKYVFSATERNLDHIQPIFVYSIQ